MPSKEAHWVPTLHLSHRGNYLEYDKRLARLVSMHKSIRLVFIVSTPPNDCGVAWHVLVISQTKADAIVVDGDFASGYVGCGSKNFVKALFAFDMRGVNFVEVLVSEKVMERILNDRLSYVGLEAIYRLPRLDPAEIYFYMRHWEGRFGMLDERMTFSPGSRVLSAALSSAAEDGSTEVGLPAPA